MARPRKDTRLFYDLIRRLEPQLREAFAAAVKDLRDGVDFPRLLASLQAGNVEAAVLALNIEPAAFQRYATVKTAAYSEAGATTVASISLPAGADLLVRFDMSNPAAERWIASEVGQRITDMVGDQVQTVRKTILAGYQRGAGPQDIAVDIAGRVKNGTRQGGVVGLDGPRAERFQAVTEGMKTPDGVQRLVIKKKDGTLEMRYKVNPASERSILAAYRKGEAVPAVAQERVVAQYGNKLALERAETIARTETAQAVMSARRQAWDGANVPPEFVLKRWVHGGGVKEPRPHHVAMSGTIVRGMDTPFEFDNGATLQMAHDPDGDPSEIIYCGCSTEFFVDPQWRPVD